MYIVLSPISFLIQAESHIDMDNPDAGHLLTGTLALDTSLTDSLDAGLISDKQMDTGHIPDK